MCLAGSRAYASENRVSGVGGDPYACRVTSTTTPATGTDETTEPASWPPLAAVAVTLVLRRDGGSDRAADAQGASRSTRH